MFESNSRASIDQTPNTNKGIEYDGFFGDIDLDDFLQDLIDRKNSKNSTEMWEDMSISTKSNPIESTTQDFQTEQVLPSLSSVPLYPCTQSSATTISDVSELFLNSTDLLTNKILNAQDAYLTALYGEVHHDTQNQLKYPALYYPFQSTLYTGEGVYNQSNQVRGNATFDDCFNLNYKDKLFNQNQFDSCNLKGLQQPILNQYIQIASNGNALMQQPCDIVLSHGSAIEKLSSIINDANKDSSLQKITQTKITSSSSSSLSNRTTKNKEKTLLKIGMQNTNKRQRTTTSSNSTAVKRKPFKPAQLSVLRREFDSMYPAAYLTNEECKKIADETELTFTQIKKWFASETMKKNRQFLFDTASIRFFV